MGTGLSCSKLRGNSKCEWGRCWGNSARASCLDCSRHTISSEFDIWETETCNFLNISLSLPRWERVDILEIENEILKRKGGSRWSKARWPHRDLKSFRQDGELRRWGSCRGWCGMAETKEKYRSWRRKERKPIAKGLWHLWKKGSGWSGGGL